MIEITDTRTLDKFVRKVVNKEKVDLVAGDEHSGYLNEFQFRFNNRKNPDIFGEAITGC